MCFYSESSKSISSLFLLATESAFLWWGFPPLLGCVISLWGGRWDSAAVSGECQERCAGCVTTVLLPFGCGEHKIPLVFSVTLLGKLSVPFWAALCLPEWWLPALKNHPSSICYTAGIQQKGHKKLLKLLPWSMLDPQPFPMVERGNTVQLCTESSLESEALWIPKLSFQATYVSSKAL